MRFLQKSRRDQTAYPFIDFKIRGKMEGIVFPCYAEVKYDGRLVTVLRRNGRLFIMTDKFQREVAPEYDQPNEDGLYLAEWISRFGEWESLFQVKDTSDDTSLKFFDILLHKDQDVSEKDLITRKEILCYCCKALTIASGRTYENIEDLKHDFKEVVDMDLEGMVVKNLNETFLAQKWVKMKPPERMTHGCTTNSE